MGIRSQSSIRLLSRRVSDGAPIPTLEPSKVSPSTEKLETPSYLRIYGTFDDLVRDELQNIHGYYRSIDSAYDTEVKAAKQLIALHANRTSWPAERGLVQQPKEIYAAIDAQLRAIGDRKLNFRISKSPTGDIVWVRNLRDGFRISGRASKDGTTYLTAVGVGNEGFSQVKIFQDGSLSLDASPKFWDSGMNHLATAELFQLLLVGNPGELFNYLNFFPAK
jgi:hypothetical protein